MSKFREKREYMAMRVGGFLGWLHRIVMLITFPIRKFWMIITVLLLILAILIAIPMFYGIQLRDVWDWYMVKMPTHEFVEAKDKNLFGAKEQVDKLRKTFKEIVPNRKSAANQKGKKEVKKTKLVSWHVAEFRKAKYKPRPAMPIIERAEDIKNEEARLIEPNRNDVVRYNEDIVEEKIDNVKVSENDYSVYEEPEPQEIATDEEMSEVVNEPVEGTASAKNISHEWGYIGNIEDYYTKIRNPDLVYLSNPLVYEGNVRVVGSNSIYVDGEFMFLYGIYSHPQRHNISAATDYLRSITSDSEVYCVAVARSKKTHSLTSLCFVDGMFINKALVNHNLAQNVALK